MREAWTLNAVAHQNGLTFIWSNPTVTGTQLERKRRPERPGEREDPERDEGERKRAWEKHALIRKSMQFPCLE